MIYSVFALVALLNAVPHSLGLGEIGNFSMSDYYKMPPMFLMDDYDRCFEEISSTRNVYCYTRSQIKPNESSPLWRIIEDFSSNKKQHFRHDRLNRGICLNWCKPHFHKWVRSAKRRYTEQKFDNTSEITYDTYSVEGAIDDRIMYDKWVNLCVNWELKRQYSLMAHSVVEYCISNRKNRHEIDSYDEWFAAFALGLLVIIVISTLIDFYLKRKNILKFQKSRFYQAQVQGTFSRLAVCFSIPRNWYRLTSGASSETAIDLRPIQAIRFLTMFCVIIGHCVLFMNMLPTFNPQYMERNYYRVITQLLINGPTVIQTFFVISGYLLSVQFMKLRRNSEFSIKYLWNIIVYRYIRLTPVYLFLILFNATWLVRLQDGPLWPHVSDPERTFCRANWWTNVFYINNILAISEPCYQHGWYLAADFQMFVVGVVLHMIFWKFPRSMKFVLTLGIMASYLIPGIITYVNQFEGVFMATPESQRYLQWYDEMYKKIYIPAYTNFGSFLCGMIGGVLFDKYKQEQFELRKFKVLVFIWYSAVPVCVMLLLSGYVFYNFEFAKPTVWIAIYSSLLKNLFGLYAAALITGMAFGIGWIVKDAMCHPVFRPLGRMTYCAYLVHPTVLRVFLGNQRQPVHSSDTAIVTNLLSTLVMSYLLAFVLCLCLEFPISALQKLIFGNTVNVPAPVKQRNRNNMELFARD